MTVRGLKYGDITTWAQKVLHDGLEAIINSKAARRKPYYVMVIVKEGYDGPAVSNANHLLHGKAPQPIVTKTVDMSMKRVVTNRFMVMEPEHVPNIPLIGTSLWRIDNKTGQVRCEYILPPDKPMIGGFSVGLDSQTVQKCAKGMPIVWGVG